jgi:HNH endonuclease
MPKGQHNRKLSDAQRQEIACRYTTAMPDGTWIGSKILAADYKVTETCIQQTLRKQGVTLRSAKEAHANGKRCKPITRLPQGTPRLCKCGCKQPTEWDRKKMRWRLYLPDHDGTQAYKDRDWLYDQYVTQRRTASEVASACNATIRIVLYYMEQFGIAVRGNQDAHTGRHSALRKYAQDNPRIGADNPSWKGGTTPERQRLYKTREWKALLKAVYLRDNYTCGRCHRGTNGGKNMRSSVAHHIKSYSDYPLLRMDMTNLITLCRECHLWVHSLENTMHEFLG